jgi:hypothetical protein
MHLILTGPISFRTPSPSTTPIQRSGLPVAPPPPLPNPVRTAQASRSPAQTGAKPIDLQAEQAQVSTTIARSSPEQIQANASRLMGLHLEIANVTNALRPASQHQVLTLTESVTDLNDEVSNDQYRSASQSGISSKGKVGSPFGVGIPLKPGAVVDVVGHGSPDGKTVGGKTPQQLAKQLKDGGATQLAVLDLKSCHSSAFKAELQKCLHNEGIQVGQIKTYATAIAVDRLTGHALSPLEIQLSPTQIDHDGFLPLGLPRLAELSLVSKVTDQGNAKIIPFKTKGTEVSDTAVKTVKDTVGVALDGVLKEIQDGSFITKLENGDPPFPGHLLSLKKYVDDPRHASLLVAGVGYLIEDRLTQVLITNHGFHGDSFQQTIGKTRPDIVIPHPESTPLAPKKPILVDLTALNSAGHILGKDSKIWFADGQESLEVTYPSFNVDFAKSVIKSSAVDTAKLQAILDGQAEEAKAFKKGMQSFLNDKIDRAMFKTASDDGFYMSPSGEKTSTPIPEDAVVDKDGFVRNGDYYLPHEGFTACAGSKDKQMAFVAKQLLGDVDQSKAKLKNAIIKYGATASFLPSAQRTGLVSDQATRAFDILFDKTDLSNNADLSDLFSDYQVRRKPLDEESSAMVISDDEDG